MPLKGIGVLIDNVEQLAVKLYIEHVEVLHVRNFNISPITLKW